MSSSKLNICNLALSHLGMKNITQNTLDANFDPSAIAMNNFFNPCRDDVFREHQWAFASTQATLNASSVDAPLPWLYAYDYPTLNAATVWTVFNEATADKKHEQDFEVFYDPTTAKKIIGSNMDDAYMEYTYIVTDTSIWDPKFIIAMSYRLAASSAHVLLGDAAKGFTLMQVYSALLSEAKRTGGSEKKKKSAQTSGYQEARG